VRFPTLGEDGIWLAEVDIPKLGQEEGTGGAAGEARYPMRSVAIVVRAGKGEDG
jgi:hypothetical protein